MRAARAVVAVTLLATTVAHDPRPALAGSLRDACINRINAIRRTHGLRALREKDAVSRYARGHSERMARAGRLWHSDLDRVLRPYRPRRYAENVGYGGSVFGIHRTFMRSRPHRRHILDPGFTHVGCGVARGRGWQWVTEIFFERRE